MPIEFEGQTPGEYATSNVPLNKQIPKIALNFTKWKL